MVRSARPRLAAVVIGAALALGGCTFASPIQTQSIYAAGDGVLVNIDEKLRIENLMVVSAEAGAPGRVLGMVVNETEDDVVVDLDLGDGVTSFAVGAGELINLTDDEPILSSTAAAPGDILEGSVSSPVSGQLGVGVPVLDGTIHTQYADVIPE